ncbi:MAG: tannase/feruloyl esterase family alpha/beta hydrolase [Terracidiphilus sp.]
MRLSDMLAVAWHAALRRRPGPGEVWPVCLRFNPALADAAQDIITPLEQWVEKGTAPEKVIARGNRDASGAGKGDSFSQPICAYPKAASYKGTGNLKDASSYTCAVK